jgi:hypothetical protein
MAFSGEKKYFCVLQLAKTDLIITVQRGFRTKYHTEPPTDETIREWYRKFEETSRSCAAKRRGRPGTVDRVRESFTRCPQKSTRRASRELEMSHVIVWRALHKRLACKPYRLQLLLKVVCSNMGRDAGYPD